jgi:type IV secretion system protein VirD4
MQEVQRPLLTPDECQRMPSPQKDEHDRITAAGDMVIYCAGHPAIYGRMPSARMVVSNAALFSAGWPLR